MKTLAVLTISLFLPIPSIASTPSRLLQQKPILKSQASEQCVRLNLGESELDCTSCKVTSLRDLKEINGQTISVAQYEYAWPNDSRLKQCGYGTVLFKRSKDVLQPIWGGFGNEKSPNAPEIFTLNGINYLLVRLLTSGNGHLEDDGLIAFESGEWQEIDTNSYQADLKKRIPADSNLAKGLHPNFTKMTVDSPIWKAGDANCCPTGGQFTAKLGIRKGSLVVTDFKKTNFDN